MDMKKGEELNVLRLFRVCNIENSFLNLNFCVIKKQNLQSQIT